MKQKFSIVIRCDASPAIGTGHVFRCMALANSCAEAGHKVTFAANKEAADLVPSLKQFKSIGDQETIPACDILVVDHYGLDQHYEAQSRKRAKKIMVIDDLADRPHNCDILLDQTFGRHRDDYKDLVPKHCAMLMGAEYALLRPEFAALRGQAREKRQHTTRAERLLVFLSGTDKDNITGKVLTALQDQTGFSRIDVVIGMNSPHERNIASLAHNMRVPTTVHSGLEASELAQLMLDADCAIGAGGTTSWERCTLGLPTLMIEIAENQKTIATQLEKAGAIINLGWYEAVSSEKITKAFSDLQGDPSLLQSLSGKAFSICDGRGLNKVLTLLETMLSTPISLRPVAETDRKTVFEWQNIPGIRQHSRNPKPPSAAEHQEWFSRALQDKNRHSFIIEYEGHACGMLRLDSKNIDANEYEISILIIPDYQKKNIAKTALKLIENLFPDCTILAEILKDNHVSQKLFMNSGYKNYKDTWYKKSLGTQGNSHA